MKNYTFRNLLSQTVNVSKKKKCHIRSLQWEIFCFTKTDRKQLKQSKPDKFSMSQTIQFQFQTCFRKIRSLIQDHMDRRKTGNTLNLKF